MEELFWLIGIPIGIIFLVQLAKWIWTAPGEFIKLLKQGPSPKLTFVFIGMGIMVFSLILLQASKISFEKEPGIYFMIIGSSAGIAGILYHIFLSTKYQTVGYFFIIILKILLVIIPTIFISIITENLVWGFTYFFLMLLITYYSIYRIKTNSGAGAETMTGNHTVKFSTLKVFKYLGSSLFQAILGYFVSMVLSNLFN